MSQPIRTIRKLGGGVGELPDSNDDSDLRNGAGKPGMAGMYS